MVEAGTTKPVGVFQVNPDTGQPLAGSGATAAAGAAPQAFTATVSTKIFDANPSAVLRTFANDSDQTLFLRFHASAVSNAAPGAAAGYTVKVLPGGYFSTDLKSEVRGIMGAAITTGWVSCSEHV